MAAETRQAMEPQSVTEIVRRYFAAYEAKDRTAVDELLTSDFTFTSPFDDHISRATYFQKCWPQSERIKTVATEAKDNVALLRATKLIAMENERHDKFTSNANSKDEKGAAK